MKKTSMLMTAALSAFVLTPQIVAPIIVNATPVNITNIAFEVDGETYTVTYEDVVDAIISEQGHLYNMMNSGSTISAIGIDEGVYVNYQALVNAIIDSADDRSAIDILGEVATDTNAIVATSIIGSFIKDFTYNENGKPVAFVPAEEVEVPSGGVTVTSLKNKYTSLFESLENEANTAVNQVADQALDEIKQAEENGEEISLVNLYNKYSKIGAELVKKFDDKFDGIYSNFVTELTNNGFDPEIATEFKEAYNQAKEEREKELKAKILKELF